MVEHLGKRWTWVVFHCGPLTARGPQDDRLDRRKGVSGCILLFCRGVPRWLCRPAGEAISNSVHTHGCHQYSWCLVLVEVGRGKMC